MNVIFIDGSSESFAAEHPVLRKYLTFENARRALECKQFWFASPKTWKDPYEKAYLKLECVNTKIRDDALCFCSTLSKTSEALWNRVGDSYAVEFVIKTKTFLKRLSEWEQQGKVYCGPVHYFDNSGNPSECTYDKAVGDVTFSHWNTVPEEIKPLFIKRDSFKYESEFRCVWTGKVQEQDGLSLPYGDNETMIREIILSPNMSKETAEHFKEWISSTFKIDKRKILHSMLYTSPFEPDE